LTGTLPSAAGSEPLSVEASDITVRVGSGSGSRITWERPNFVLRDEGRHQILARSSLRFELGELAAVIGESGAGKTTLLRTLAGVTSPTRGQVMVGGRPVREVRGQIGYVPQESIVHDGLSVREALDYAARLRLPMTARRADIDAAVARVLDELDLGSQARVRIRSLSGGQRKRVAVGTELLNRPGLLFLDEPTTGLDPALEARLMGLFRTLADHGRTLVVATHATRSLSLCDKLAVIGRGGNLAFFGAPEESLRFFGVSSFDAIYQALLDRPAHRWRSEFEQRGARSRNDLPAHGVEPVPSGEPPAGSEQEPGRDSRRPTPAGPLPGPEETSAQPGRSPRRPLRRVARHTRALSARYARLFLRDRRTLFLLLLQAPLIAGAIVSVFDPSVFLRRDLRVDPELVDLAERLGADALRQLEIGSLLELLKDAGSNPLRAAQLLYALVIAAIFLGSINSAREVVKERGIVERESAAGVGSGCYLASKLVVLLALVVAQVALMCAVVFVFRPLDAPDSAHVMVFGTLVLVAFAAVAMGLLISAATRTQEQAIGVIPLTLIPQLLFTGALVPVAQMAEPVATISAVAYGQSAFAGLGAAIDLNARIADNPAFARLDEFGTSFFAVAPADVVASLGGFLLAFLLLTLVLLPRRRKPAR